MGQTIKIPPALWATGGFGLAWQYLSLQLLHPLLPTVLEEGFTAPPTCSIGLYSPLSFLCNVFFPFWGDLGTNWGILERLEASWGRLGTPAPDLILLFLTKPSANFVKRIQELAEDKAEKKSVQTPTRNVRPRSSVLLTSLSSRNPPAPKTLGGGTPPQGASIRRPTGDRRVKPL